jgi:hypothetical protein
MDPDFAMRLLGLSVVVPAVVALVVAAACARSLPIAFRERWEAPVAIACGYIAGYLCQPALTDYIPSRPWHWTLYLAPAAAIVGPLCATPRIPTLVRWLLAAAALSAGAYFLTPTWKSLWPPRLYCIPLLAGYLLVLYATVQPLASRVAPVVFHAALTATMLGITLIIASAVALVNAQVALIAVGAMTGYALLLWLSSAPPRPLGVAMLFAALAGGWAFFGTIQPKLPEWGLLLAPFAPATFWLADVGPLARLQGKSRVAAQLGLVLFVLAISVAIVEGL